MRYDVYSKSLLLATVAVVSLGFTLWGSYAGAQPPSSVCPPGVVKQCAPLPVASQGQACTFLQNGYTSLCYEPTNHRLPPQPAASGSARVLSTAETGTYTTPPEEATYDETNDTKYQGYNNGSAQHSEYAMPPSPPKEPTWYFREGFHQLFRLGFGKSWAQNNAANGISGFTFDATLGPRAAVHRHLNLVADVGYASTSGSSRSTYLALLGIGPELNVSGNNYLLLRYAPRFALGSRGGELAYGVRHGAAASIYSLFGAEFSHQVLRNENSTQHEVIVVGTIDPSVVFVGLFFLVGGGPGAPIH